MYLCTLPNEHSLKNLDNHFERCVPNDPVVIFLDTRKVKAIIDRVNGEEFIPGPRFVNSERMLDNGEFELPIIMQCVHKPALYQGRHRTCALLAREEFVAPYLTARGMAEAIKAIAGVSSKLTPFDLKNIPYPVM